MLITLIAEFTAVKQVCRFMDKIKAFYAVTIEEYGKTTSTVM